MLSDWSVADGDADPTAGAGQRRGEHREAEGSRRLPPGGGTFGNDRPVSPHRAFFLGVARPAPPPTVLSLALAYLSIRPHRCRSRADRR
jgi:hypothetical protein